jgi:predicted dehydrogenase
MLNQRTLPLHQEIRRRILNGELGNLTRLTWIATHWFRPDAYFRSSPWRATWKGEGGGVLINQAHHNLDLLYWLTGMMPRTITAVGSRGKHHPIETEDEVSAILEYESGMVAHFITSTGEAPGTNRLEIAGTRGKLVAEDGKLTFHRLATDSRDFSRSATEPFSAPPVTVAPVPLAPAPSPDHRPIVEDFAATIAAKKTSAALLAPAADALPAIELSNALLMAALTRHPVPLPLDCPTYDAFLARMSTT